MAHFIAIALQVLMYWNKEDTEEMLEELEEVCEGGSRSRGRAEPI